MLSYPIFTYKHEFLNNPRLFRESVIFIYNLQIYLLSTDFCIFAIHKIFHPVGSLYFSAPFPILHR